MDSKNTTVLSREMGTPPPPEQGTTIADQAQIPRLDQLCTALVVANLVRGSGRSKAAAWLETFVSHFRQQIHTFSAPPMLQPFWRCICRPGVGHAPIFLNVRNRWAS